CLPKLLAGNARIWKPLSLYVSYNFSSVSYCGVNPHLEAVFTIISTFPLYDESGRGLPSMVFIVKSNTLFSCIDVLLVFVDCDMAVCELMKRKNDVHTARNIFIGIEPFI